MPPESHTGSAINDASEPAKTPVSRSRLWSWLELMRPANIATAIADILAGFSVGITLGFTVDYGRTGIWAGSVEAFFPVQWVDRFDLPPIPETGLELFPEWQGLLWLLLATAGLYGGGVVLNDVFDADLDARERPERPIPSGRVARSEAGWLGALLLTAGVAAAFQVSTFSGGLALVLVLLILLYNSRAKHHAVWGPMTMGLCRGGNLLLGISIIPAVVTQVWFLALFPIVYIAAITLISQGEVHGGSRKTGVASLLMLVLVFAGIPLIARFVSPFYLTSALAFLLVLAALMLPAFLRAALTPDPERIRAAVKRGVLSLIVLNAVIGAGFAGLMMGLSILLLLPISLLLGRLFAVT